MIQIAKPGDLAAHKDWATFYLVKDVALDGNSITLELESGHLYDYVPEDWIVISKLITKENKEIKFGIHNRIHKRMIRIGHNTEE